MFEKRSRATSFDLQAAEYARLRPGYPPAAIDAAISQDSRVVLDLAAGTGKLTGALLDRGLEVIAVEPLPGMLAELGRLFPGAQAICGTAEDIPLADSTVDAVVVGQAFHWFHPEKALSEMVRVLRPGGTLALLWNHDDESDPFVADIYAALTVAGRPAGGSTGRGKSTSGGDGHATVPESKKAPFSGYRALTDPELTEISWQRSQSLEELIGLLQTYSYVIRAPDATRAALDTAVRGIAERHGLGQGALRIPVVCQVWRSRRC